MTSRALVSIVLIGWTQAACSGRSASPHEARQVPAKESQSIPPKVTVLYCPGKSWRSVVGTEEIATDAVVRIADRDTYVEINGVGSGLAQEPPGVVSSMEVAGSITLQSAAVGGPEIEASYNLNRYSGELIVMPSPSGSGKLLFRGVCKPAKPLF